ncbi:UNVERIFIED_CONTAM: hypothetical protein FKN15_008427 [Acipenser sinensis]
MEAAHISPELPIRWVVSADRTVEIKEEVTELGCDQANERILQDETPPSSITERGTNMKLPELKPVPVKPEVIKLEALLNEGEESHDLYANGEEGTELGSIQRKPRISQQEAIQIHPSSQHEPRSTAHIGGMYLNGCASGWIEDSDSVHQILSILAESVWCRPRSSDWGDRIGSGTFSYSAWIENFRMSKGTFNCICQALIPALERNTTNLRMCITVEMQVARALWKLATDVENRIVGLLFGVSKTSFCHAVYTVWQWTIDI